MTPLESLLMAAEALRDVMMKVYDYEAGVAPVVGRFDAALARYRAEPDLEARVAKLEAAQKAMSESPALAAAWNMVPIGARMPDALDKIEMPTDEEMRAAAERFRAARAVREGQNEQERSRYPERQAAADSHAAPACGGSAGDPPLVGVASASGSNVEGAAGSQVKPGGPASPPAFARETPREWSEEQREAARKLYPITADCDDFIDALCRELTEIAPLFASPPPETRTDADLWPSEWVEKHAAQPPPRETLDREALALMLFKAWNAACGNCPSTYEDGFGKDNDCEHDRYLDCADATIQFVSEHVARVERRANAAEKHLDAAEQAAGHSKFSSAPLSSTIDQIKAERNAAFEREATLSNEVDTLKAECERLREAEAFADRARVEWCNAAMRNFDDLENARARADAAERKLEEEERALTHAREEIHRLTKEVNAAEKKLEEAEKALGEWKRWEGREVELPPGSKSIIFKPSGHHEVDVHVPASPSAPAPDEAIEKYAAHIAHWYSSETFKDGIVNTLRRFWPSPAVGRGVTREMVLGAMSRSDFDPDTIADRLNAALGVARKGET